MQEGKPHVRRAVQAYPCLAKTSAWFAARVSVRALCAHFLPIVASSSPFPSRTGRSLPATPAARTPPGAQALAPLPVCNTQMVFVNIDPSEGDPQAELKCSLLARLPANAADLDIPRLMQRARITCMNEMDVYHYTLPDGTLLCDFDQPLNARNEGSALGLLVRAVVGVGVDTPPPLTALLDNYAAQGAAVNGDGRLGRSCCEGTESESTNTDSALMRWASSVGIEGAIEPGVFEGMGRGAMAARDVRPGDTVVSIPQDRLISLRQSAGTPLGTVLSGIPTLDDDTKTVLWCMADRADPGSASRECWDALPSHFSTGATLSQAARDVLAGSPLSEEVASLQESLRSQYDALFPALCEAIPGLFPADVYTWENFEWMAGLWYSYPFDVEYPDGTCTTCLLPVAQLMNHSPWPHVSRYGRVDANTKRLEMPAFRKAARGEQVFLSYGVRPNHKLLLFYGFAIPRNPHDFVNVTLDMPEDGLEERKRALLERWGVGLDHQLCMGVPPRRLLMALRVMVEDREGLGELEEMPPASLFHSPPTATALRAMGTVCMALREPFKSSEDPHRDIGDNNNDDVHGKDALVGHSGDKGDKGGGDRDGVLRCGVASDGVGAGVVAEVRFARVYMWGCRCLIEWGMDWAERQLAEMGEGGDDE